MSHAHPTPTTTVASVLGALTPDAIARVTDAGVRDELESARQFATGAATALLAGTGDAHAGALATSLGEVHLTLDDVRGLVADALTLLAQHEDRLAQEARFHAAVALANRTERAIHAHLSAYANLLRGKLGPKSDQLEQFGVAPLLPGRHAAAAKKAAAADPRPSTG